MGLREKKMRLSASLVLTAVACLGLAARAQAGELVYWDNFDAVPETYSVANIDGSGGGPLNLSGTAIDGPEGMTFDSTTGRLYIAASVRGPTGSGQIVYVNVDGSGAGVLSTPGAEVNTPLGVDIDPTTRTIYWANNLGGLENKGSIGFAKLDGSGGGRLNTAGVRVERPNKVAVDLATGKLYWGNNNEAIAFANLDNSGGGDTLDVTGAPEPPRVRGVAVDAAAGRVYWLDSAEHVSFASVNGGGGGELKLGEATFSTPFGLAVDPTIGRVYWGNLGQGQARLDAIGFVNLAGGAGGITPQTAPVDGPQDPVILKSPTATAPPTATRAADAPAKLGCSEGTWAADLTGSFVFQAPRTIAYQWIRNGAPLAGATAATFSAKSPGSYSCIATAANQAGTASQASAPITVKAAKLKLTTKRKAKATPGQIVKFKLTAKNRGDLTAKKPKVCVMLPKSAKGALKAPKCKSLGGIVGRRKKSVTLKLKVLGSAQGTYKLTFKPKGARGKPARSKLIVS
jgi:uncharacterized repeat protein (TIGR01451 family)